MCLTILGSLSHRPVCTDFRLGIRCIQFQHTACIQLIDILINRVRSWNISMYKINLQYLRINRIVEVIQLCNTSKVRSKRKMSIYKSIIKRLFTNSVTDQCQLLSLSVQQSNGKHSLTHGNCFSDTICLESLQKHFCIRSSAERSYLMFCK